MGYTRRSTRSTGKGSRTTSTRTITNKGTTRQTISRSTGSKVQRHTSSTNMNSGGRTKHYVTTNMGGWKKVTLLNPVGRSIRSKTKKPKKYKSSKSKPLGVFGWSVLIIILISLAYS